MQVTNRCKTVTFSGTAAFAVMCALRQRLETLNTRKFHLDQTQASPHVAEMANYVAEQIAGVIAAIEAMGGVA